MLISVRVLKLALFAGVIILIGVCIVQQLLPVKQLKPGVNYALSPEDNFVHIDTDVPDVQLHFRYYPGDGGDVVLIHGFASSAYTWEAMVSELRKNYAESGKKTPRIWALDMKGFGWSDKPFNAKYDPFSLTDDVNAWMTRMGIDDATVVGNSLGGAVAGILALNYPDKVRRLALIDSGGYPVEKKNGVKFVHIPFLRITGPLLFNRLIVKEALQSAFYDPGKVTAERVNAYFSRLKTRGGIAAQALVLKSLNSERIRTYGQRIKDIKQPTLIIWGQNDTWIPPQCGMWFRCDIQGSALVIIPHSGHVSQEEHPEEIAALLYRFLEGMTIQSVEPACDE